MSFDGCSPETYSLYHGVAYFDKVVKNIKMLVSAKNKLRSFSPFIELQFILMKENEWEIAKIKKLSGELGVNKITFLRLDKDKINFSKFNLLSYSDILPKNQDFILNKNTIQEINHCSIPCEGTLVRYSGLVLPCVEDIGQSYNMGRVFHNGRYLGFKQIWNGDNYRNFRSYIKKSINEIKICCNCAQRNNNIEDQIFLC